MVDYLKVKVLNYDLEHLEQVLDFSSEIVTKTGEITSNCKKPKSNLWK